MLQDEIYLNSYHQGIKKVVGDSLELIPGGESFAKMFFNFFLPFEVEGEDVFALAGSASTHKLYTYDGKGFKEFPISKELESFFEENRLYMNAIALVNGEVAFPSLRGGLVIMDRKGEVKLVLDENQGLQDQFIINLFQDREENIWLSLGDGISRLEYPSPLAIFDQRLGLDVPVYHMTRHMGKFCLATEDGVYLLDEQEREKGDFSNFSKLAGINDQSWKIIPVGNEVLIANAHGVYQIKDKDVFRLSQEHAFALHQSRYDPERIWLGEKDGLRLMKKSGEAWIISEKIPEIKGKILNIIEEDAHHLWISTWTDEFIRISFPQEEQSQFREKVDGSQELILIPYAIDFFGPEHALPSGFVRMAYVDGKLMTYTTDGLLRYDEKQAVFIPDKRFGKELATPGLIIDRIAQDQKGDLWMAIIENGEVEIRRYEKGLEGNYGSDPNIRLRKSVVGEFIDWIYPDPEYPDMIWFAGNHGLIRYNSALSPKSNIDELPKTQIRSVYVRGDSMIFGGAPGIDQLAESLAYEDNEIRFRYASSFLKDPERNSYQFFLQGFDKSWSAWTSESQKDYTNIPEGKYKFRVRSRDYLGRIAKEGSLSFQIKAPWYRTPWAYTFYLLLIGLLIRALLYWRFRHLESRNNRLEDIVNIRTRELKKQKDRVELQKERLKELDELKSQVFTNLSHEFRTPLTVILGMANQIKHSPDKWLDKGVNMIERNGSSLLNLINQLLDLQKLSAGKLKTQYIQGNIIQYIQYIFESFQSLALLKDQQLHFLSSESQYLMDYDPDKLLHIISNLLSNAIKFTPDKGNIYIQLDVNHAQEGDFLKIRVKDTGKGISPENLPFIFDRFYQVEEKGSAQSTGIGLALTYQLITLMHGDISVTSKLAKGSCFEVLLPITHHAPLTEFCGNTLSISPYIRPECGEEISCPKAGGQASLLIVEDNADLMQYLLSCLEGQYKLFIARDGQEGFDLALKHVPDLIISDVIMPNKNGYEFCSELKTDSRISHIPVVLLTARFDEQSRIQGFKHGADAYLAKPFNPEELSIRLEQLLKIRQELQKRYQEPGWIGSREAVTPSQDDEFILQLKRVVEEHLDEEDFKVVDLCREMGLSRTQLHQKIKALTGRPTSHFVRSIRLHKARTMLQNANLNISEIAYSVGFSDPRYFSRTYAEEFGETPSRTRSEAMNTP
ncbi:MAG: hybrid sensor histidine kinase/response regulator transcription factor [Bacteroidota bacterium]